MEFIREKIKEKPISKRRIAMRVGMAALCGLVFAAVACVVLVIAVPLIMSPQNSSEAAGTQEDTQQDTLSQDSQKPNGGLILPPDFNLSISDYETLQDELYKIGDMANRFVVTVMPMESKDDWTGDNAQIEGQGAGIIFSEDSNYLYILTERKIIADAAHVRVSFIDKTGADATLFKYDGNTGIAVLTVEKRQLKLDTKRAIAIARMGSINEVKNGALVIALGCPLGTNYSILTGNITSTENKVATKDKNYLIYTTDIVGSKNASGVLINSSGEVIGMVMQSFSNPQDVSTLTAVTMKEINAIIMNLKNGKDVPYVGVYIATVTEDIAKDYNIPKGVFIKEVIADSPAMKAGLQNGDVITHINGEPILTDAMFSEKISQLIPGTKCEIAVKRQNGKEYYSVTCEVTIDVLKE